MNLFNKRDGDNMIKILLSFYVLLSSPVLINLLSKQWKKILEDNRLAQHFVAFLTLLCLVIIYSDYDTEKIIFFSVIVYLLFILSTKMDIHFTVLLLLLLIIFVLYIKQNEKKNSVINTDNNLEQYEKENLINKNISLYCPLAIMIIGGIITGTLLYSKRKVGQYGGSYSLVNYLLY